MNDLPGHTRDVVKTRYALRTPAGFVPSVLPGWTRCRAVVQISPGMGARFSQTQIDLESGGAGAGQTGANELLAYTLSGRCSAKLNGRNHALTAGSFVYAPPQTDFQFRAQGRAALLLFEKNYAPLDGSPVAPVIVGHERRVAAKPFLGCKNALLQTLLPEDLRFDMAVNIFTYQPGAALPLVESHIMEHGLLMLQGRGIYRLDADWHPVQAGDVIWMAPYCPQWFAAIGDGPASYIYYKDVNRPALG